MKAAILFCALFIYHGIVAQDKFKCPCDKIGLDVKWAAENKVNCYFMSVPRDGSAASGKHNLAVAVAEAKSNASAREPLLYLHGGPGIATLGNLPKYLKSKTWDRMREDRPLVFFDYRGTGESEPLLCPGLDKTLAEASTKMSPAEVNTLKLELLRKCRAAHLAEGIDIASFSSHQSAQDANAVRLNLNIPTWSVYGVSHGTTVALNLLRDHAKSVNAMILDSPFPPNAPWLDFVRPFAVSFENLEQKILEDPNAAARFPTIRKSFANAYDSLNKEPLQIAVDNKGNTRPFTGNDFAWSIWNALLKPIALPVVPLAITEFEKRNASIVMPWMMSFSDPNGFGKFSEYQSKAILCFEGGPRSADDTKDALARKYPEFAAFNMDFEDELCAAWQPKGAPASAFLPVSSDVPVLVISGEYDPVCPPVFGELTAKTLSRSTFVTVPAASHAAIHADDCMRDLAIGFLAQPGAAVDTQCVANRPKVSFVTQDLASALEKVKKESAAKK